MDSSFENNNSSFKSLGGKRISVVLSDDAEKMLYELAKTQSISKSEALRRAIATESYFIEQKRKGAKVFIREQNNSLTEVVFR